MADTEFKFIEIGKSYGHEGSASEEFVEKHLSDVCYKYMHARTHARTLPQTDHKPAPRTLWGQRERLVSMRKWQQQ